MFAFATDYFGFRLPKRFHPSSELDHEAEFGVKSLVCLLSTALLILWLITLRKSGDGVPDTEDEVFVERRKLREFTDLFTLKKYRIRRAIQRVEERLVDIQRFSHSCSEDSDDSAQSYYVQSVSECRDNTIPGHLNDARRRCLGIPRVSCGGSRSHLSTPHRWDSGSEDDDCSLYHSSSESMKSFSSLLPQDCLQCSQPTPAPDKCELGDVGPVVVTYLPDKESACKKHSEGSKFAAVRPQVEMEKTVAEKQKIARKRWRCAILMIRIVRMLFSVRLRPHTTALPSKTKRCTVRKTASVPTFPPRVTIQCDPPRTKPKSITMYLQGAKIPFISLEVREKLEAHVRRKLSQQLWGFPKLLTKYVGDQLIAHLPKSGSKGDGKPVKNLTKSQVLSGQRRKHVEQVLRKRHGQGEALQATTTMHGNGSNARKPEQNPTVVEHIDDIQKIHTPREALEDYGQMTPERKQLAMERIRKCLQMKLSNLPKVLVQSHAALSPVSRPQEKCPIPAKRLRPLPGRLQDVAFMNQEALRRVEQNLMQKHTEYLQGISTAYTRSLEKLMQEQERSNTRATQGDVSLSGARIPQSD